MRASFYIFVYVTIGLAVLVGADPVLEDRSKEGLQLVSRDFKSGDGPVDPVAYDPSLEYDYHQTVQVWVGKDKVSVGNVIGANLYVTVWKLLDQACPSDTNAATCSVDRTDICFKTATMTKDGLTCIHELRAEWGTEQLRKLLIGLVAGTMEALTKRYLGGEINCFNMIGDTACNVGDVVRANMVPYGEKKQYFHIKLWNDMTGYGKWDCCEGHKLQLVDKAVDGLGGEIGDVMHQEFTRNSLCITPGWKICPL